MKTFVGKEYRWGMADEIVKVVGFDDYGATSIVETRDGERLYVDTKDLRPLGPAPEHRADVRPGPTWGVR